MKDTVTHGFNYKRIFVAAVILPLLVVYIYFLPLPFFFLLLLIVAVLAMREFYVMYEMPAFLSIPALFIGGVFLYAVCQYPEHFIESVFISFFLLMVIRLFAIRTAENSITQVGILSTGLFYVSVFLSFQWFIRNELNGVKFIFLLYASVWIADSMAYYIGKYLGKNKLYPSISPNKTIEGAIGSVIGGAVGAVAASGLLRIHDLSIMGSIFTGSIIGFATMIGDLIESMFKRDAGVKDSSDLIPGHGGILDKIDGILVAGPVLYLIVRYLS